MHSFYNTISILITQITSNIKTELLIDAIDRFQALFDITNFSS
jgi:hypothetical protein